MRCGDGHRAIAAGVGVNTDWRHAIAHTQDIITSVLGFFNNKEIARSHMRVSRVWYAAGWMALRPTRKSDTAMLRWAARTDNIAMFERILAHHATRWNGSLVSKVLCDQAASPTARVFDTII